jgi:hypothetical protein
VVAGVGQNLKNKRKTETAKRRVLPRRAGCNYLARQSEKLDYQERITAVYRWRRDWPIDVEELDKRTACSAVDTGGWLLNVQIIGTHVVFTVHLVNQLNVLLDQHMHYILVTKSIK